jgi:tetratricopeptide (TPR) repeat protein
MNTGPRWERVQDLFHLALGRGDASLKPFLESLSAEDAVLGREVASLVEAHVRTGPVQRLDEDPTPVGATIGPYRLVSALGMGGMGVVYRAERVTPDFVQRVALKLLPSGCTSAELEARMALERKVLAQLEHPGIARLIDGGTTPEGQSFIAMEYVEGKPLAEFARWLPVRQKLRLILEICDALEFAHQHLVVHGDLKPGNILVTNEGHAKLLDFGLAARLEVEGLPSGRTENWFTPAYASPEQIRGQRVTTSTDIYALGVILYELLSGVRPYETSGLPPVELENRICEFNPPPPSDLAPAKSRRELRGDLDAIVLRALAKDPAERYASVYRLAEDLRRHLLQRPVTARGATAGYTLAKYLLRNRTALSTAALLAALLVIGAVALDKYVDERHEREMASRVAAQAEEVTALAVDLIRAADPRDGIGDVDAASLAQLHFELGRAERLSGQPLVQARLFDALGQVFVSVGEHQLGRNLLERTLALRQKLHGINHPDVLESLEHLARALEAEGEFRRAEEFFRQALAREEILFPLDDLRRARTLSALGELLSNTGQLRESEALHRESLYIRSRKLPADHALVAASRLGLAGALEREGDYASAETIIREVLATRRQALGPEHSEVGAILLHLATVVAERPSGDREAERLAKEGVDIQTRALGAESLQRVPGLLVYAHVLAQRGHHEEAEQELRTALELRTRVLGARHPEVAATLDELSDEIEAQGRPVAAETMRRESLAIRRAGLGARHPAVGGSLSRLARTAAAEGDWVTAESLAREALELRERAHGRQNALVAKSLVQVGLIRAKRGDPEEAMTLLGEARAILAGQVRPAHAELARIDRLLDQLQRPPDP